MIRWHTCGKGEMHCGNVFLSALSRQNMFLHRVSGKGWGPSKGKITNKITMKASQTQTMSPMIHWPRLSRHETYLRRSKFSSFIGFWKIFSLGKLQWFKGQMFKLFKIFHFMSPPASEAENFFLYHDHSSGFWLSNNATWKDDDMKFAPVAEDRC